MSPFISSTEDCVRLVRPPKSMNRLLVPMIKERALQSQERSEERATARYPITAWAHFKWTASDETWHQGTGLTQDISARGALVLAQEVPPLGARVEVTVMVPPGKLGEVAKAHLRGKGTVVRVTSAVNFAAEVIFHVLRVDDSGNPSPL